MSAHIFPILFLVGYTLWIAISLVIADVASYAMRNIIVAPENQRLVFALVMASLVMAPIFYIVSGLPCGPGRGGL